MLIFVKEESSFKAGKGGRNVNKRMYTAKAEYITIAVTIAKRIHLFPFRTQKLSSFTPKVLAVNRREDR